MQDGPRAVRIVGLKRVGRPVADGAVEIQDRLGGLGRPPRGDRRLERLLEPGRPRRAAAIAATPVRWRSPASQRAAAAAPSVARRAVSASPRAAASSSSRPSFVPAGNTRDRPRRRTVTPPRPETATVFASRSATSTVCSSMPSTHASSGQHALHHREPPLAEITEARVVRAALGVVVVRDDHARALEAGRAHEIEPVEPVHGMTDLVDLVHRNAEAAERQRRRAREHDRAALGELGGERLGHRRAAPDRERVRRAARPGEHEAGRAQPRERGRLGERGVMALVSRERPENTRRLRSSAARDARSTRPPAR